MCRDTPLLELERGNSPKIRTFEAAALYRLRGQMLKAQLLLRV